MSAPSTACCLLHGQWLASSPVLVNYIREYNVTHGVPKADAYNVTMYIMAGLLVIGFLCNLFIKAVHQRFYMRADHDAEMAQMTVGAAGEPAGA